MNWLDLCIADKLWHPVCNHRIQQCACPPPPRAMATWSCHRILVVLGSLRFQFNGFSKLNKAKNPKIQWPLPVAIDFGQVVLRSGESNGWKLDVDIWVNQYISASQISTTSRPKRNPNLRPLPVAIELGLISKNPPVLIMAGHLKTQIYGHPKSQIYGHPKTQIYGHCQWPSNWARFPKNLQSIPILRSPQNPDLRSPKNPNLRPLPVAIELGPVSKNPPILRSPQNPDLRSPQIPDLRPPQNPDLRSPQNPDLRSPKILDLRSINYIITNQ